MDGWSGSVKGAYDDYSVDTCPTGGALTAALGDVTTHIADLDQATWTFSVPSGEAMTGATLWRSESADGGAAVLNATYESYLAGPSGGSVFDECVFAYGCPTGLGNPTQPFASVNRIAVTAANLGAHLYLNAACGGESGWECPAGHGDANGYAAVAYLYAADVTLEQSQGPAAKEVSGPLATEKTVQGTSDVLFNASDPDAGIWEAVFSVDGRVVQSTVPNEAGGRCRNVGETTDGSAAFLYVQPCPRTEGVDVGFDTTAVPNGAHHLLVTVVDPAGNSAPVLDKEIDVENPVPPTGAAKAGPGTGHTSMRLPRARLKLHIEPRRLSIRRSIHFSGRLLGGSIPKGGKLLVLEARRPSPGTSRGRKRSASTSGRRQRGGKWVKFDVVRTDPSGRYHGTYNFKFLGPGRYELRVLSEVEPDYLFAVGTSNVVPVRVTP